MTGFTIQKTSRKRLFRYALIVLVLILLCAVLFRILKRKNTEYRTPLPAVEIVKPQIKTVSQSLNLAGYIEALSSVPVVPLVNGIITEYPVKTGMQVSKGDILARIDKKPFTQQMLQARAVYESSENTYKRISALYESNAATRQELESAQAQRDGSKAAYTLALLQLEHADVTSPIAGTVLDAPLSEGSLGSTERPLAIIADLSELIVRTDIPEKYFALFNDREKMPKVFIKTNAAADPLRAEARIDTVSPYIQADTKTFRTVFALTENIDRFTAGMSVYVGIVYNTAENVPALSLSVLRTDGSCYAYHPESETVSVHSFPAAIKDSEWFTVPEEFKDTWFVQAGQYGIFDGQKVRAVKNAKEGTPL